MSGTEGGVNLIVEDQPMMRKVLRLFLELQLPQGKTLEAENGAQALALAAKSNPSLILMDVDLPDADGIELTRQIKATNPAVRIIVVTAKRGAVYAERAIAAGAAALVPKDRILAELPGLVV